VINGEYAASLEGKDITRSGNYKALPRERRSYS